MNVAKVIKDMGKIVSNLKLGESRPLTSREKAGFVVTRCKHTLKKNAACLECIASAIGQYEVYAAWKQKKADCVALCPHCTDEYAHTTFSGYPTKSHRVFHKKRRPRSDWQDIPCKAAALHKAWDRGRQETLMAGRRKGTQRTSHNKGI